MQRWNRMPSRVTPSAGLLRMTTAVLTLLAIGAPLRPMPQGPPTPAHAAGRMAVLGASPAPTSTVRTPPIFGGNTWKVMPSGTTHELNAVTCLSATSCLAVGAGGTIIASEDGGRSWLSQRSGTKNDLWAISCASSASCVIAGDAGTILTTKNGGASWTSRHSGVTTTLYTMACASGDYCVATTGQRDDSDQHGCRRELGGDEHWVQPRHPWRDLHCPR